MIELILVSIGVAIADIIGLWLISDWMAKVSQ